MRYIIIGFSILGLLPIHTKADSLSDISKFATEICSDIKAEGSISREEVQAKLSGKISGIAKLIGASVAADGTIKVENSEYKGLPYDALPDQMKDARACKKDIAKMLISERNNLKKK